MVAVVVVDVVLAFVDETNVFANKSQTSVETARDVQADKSLKTKAEKERIIREKNANNTKRWLLLTAPLHFYVDLLSTQLKSFQGSSMSGRAKQ